MNEKKERENLKFKDSVTDNFAFLSKYGFTCVSDSTYMVEYQSSLAYINIYHERISFELYLLIGLLQNKGNNELYLNDILDANNQKNFYWQASNEESLRNGLAHLAQILKLFGEKALLGEEEYFKQVIVLREKIFYQRKVKHELGLMEAKAKEAWKDKDYKMVIKLYTPYRDQLTDVQRHRLQYCKKRLTKRVLFSSNKALGTRGKRPH